MNNISSKLHGLIFDAVDVKKLTNWPSAMVEDYLNLVESLISVIKEINSLITLSHSNVEPQKYGNDIKELKETVVFGVYNPINFGVFGPASALDNEVPVFDGVIGKKIKAKTNVIITTNLIRAKNKTLLLEGATGITPVSGAGTRLMWIPAKASFIAGKVDGNHWDDANIGFGCANLGREGITSANYSAHFGYNGVASGLYSIHSGYEGIASGNYSAHFGRSGIASGNYSAHFGYNGIASGDYSAHFGYNGIVGGAFSIVGGRGMQLTAAADRTFVYGYSSIAVPIATSDVFLVFPVVNTGRFAIGTTTPATSAAMDITSTTGALLLPRMTTVQRDALTAVNGMVLYNTTLNQTQTYENGAWRQL